jgi:hypothetical protein
MPPAADAAPARQSVIRVTCIHRRSHNISPSRRAMSDESQRPEPDPAVLGVLAALALGVAILCLVTFVVFGA